MSRRHVFMDAIVFLGHPFLGGGRGWYTIAAGIHLDPDPEVLAAASATRQLAPELYLLEEAEWQVEGSAENLFEEAPEGLCELLQPLQRQAAVPLLVSRPVSTPRMLRAALLYRPESIVEKPRPIVPERLSLQAGDARVGVFLELRGAFHVGSCHLGLLRSYGLVYEPWRGGCCEQVGARPERSTHRRHR